MTYLYDNYFSENKIKVIFKLYLSSLVCNIYIISFLSLFRKFIKVRFTPFYFGNYGIICKLIIMSIIVPIFEEVMFRGGIILTRLIEKDYENDNNKIYFIKFLKIFMYGYSVIRFPFIHIVNFNSDDMNTITLTSFVMLYYGIPTIYLTYLSHKYSLIRSIIFHSFINTNILLFSYL